MTHAEKEVRNQKIVELRKQGYSQSQLAEMFGLTSVGSICKRYGVSGVMSCRKAEHHSGSGNQYTKRTDEEKREYVESFLPFGFSYDSGYIDCDHHVNIRCNVCDDVFDVSMITVRKHKKIICQNCKRLELDRKRIEKQEQYEEKKRQRQRNIAAERFLKTKFIQCEVCGKVFSTLKDSRRCCSSECSKKWANKRRDRRIAKDKRIDKDITVKKLYERDNGKCWICGGICDLNDYITKDDVIICGDTYPSIDHIVPVCEGGEDAWSNVKLAHRSCNLGRYLSESRSPSNF